MPKLSADDVHGEEVHVHSFKRRLERAHLVEHDADGPYVTFERVWTAFNDLWRQVIRRSDHRPRHIYRVPQYSGYPEVTYLDDTLLGQKDVLTFDVSMQDLSIVHMLHAEAYLGEPVQDL